MDSLFSLYFYLLMFVVWVVPVTAATTDASFLFPLAICHQTICVYT